MRAVIQRVRSAQVSVQGDVVAQIGVGLLVLVGIADGDSESEAALLADRVAGMRIFSDSNGKFASSVLDVKGAVLAVSQFTLFGDPWSGRRPFFGSAAPPERAEGLFARFVDELRRLGVQQVGTGVFGAQMMVGLENDGPVTIVVDTDDRAAR